MSLLIAVKDHSGWFIEPFQKHHEREPQQSHKQLDSFSLINCLHLFGPVGKVMNIVYSNNNK